MHLNDNQNAIKDHVYNGFGKPNYGEHKHSPGNNTALYQSV